LDEEALEHGNGLAGVKTNLAQGGAVAQPGGFAFQGPNQQRDEFTDSLSAPAWTPLPGTAIGNGEITILTDPAATNRHRFYRASRRDAPRAA
jgi:hypothetical protein